MSLIGFVSLVRDDVKPHTLNLGQLPPIALVATVLLPQFYFFTPLGVIRPSFLPSTS